MASGSGGGSRKAGGRAGGGKKNLKFSAAMARRTSESYMAMNRKNRVRGQRNATVKTSDFLPF